MVKRSYLIVGAVLAALFLFMGRGRGGSGGGNGGSGGFLRSLNIQAPDPLNLRETPEGRNDLIAPVNPGNLADGGPIYVGPDPLELGQSEEGRNDLIAPVNPRNVVDGGPVYTGPDPFNLGGN